MAVTFPSTNILPMGWTFGVTTDSNKAMSVQVNNTSGGHILYPGSGDMVSSVSLAQTNYEFLVLQFDGSNFRVTGTTPGTAAAVGIAGSTPDINRWNFPVSPTYTAGQADNGNALSSYNTATGLNIILPSTSAIVAGWTMGFTSDNGKPLSVQVNTASGGSILEPAQGGTSVSSIALAAGQNYEYIQLRFDGNNFRIVNATPQTLNTLGGLISLGAPASSTTMCNVGQLQADMTYFYFCVAPNTWKRAVLSNF